MYLGPEYGAWMVEATPSRPYTGFTNDLLRVERNMRLRRQRLISVLHDNEIAPTVTTFFMLGAMGDDGSVPPTKVGGKVSVSAYIGDGIINPHPRFGTLTANIRQRRGEKVCISIPLYRDVNTPEFKDLETAASNHGCCGSDSIQLWRYGKADSSRKKYGPNFVVVGCSTGTDEYAESQQHTLCKWLVDVQCTGCRGLFYRSAPNVIVPDADWPRNGEVVVGSEIPDIPGWIRLQNGYYLPTHSNDGKLQFMRKITERTSSSPQPIKKNLPGSSVPLFRKRSSDVSSEMESLALGDTATTALLEEDPLLAEKKPDLEKVRPAIHMDAMAFGMGCSCLQVTFQGRDVDESRFLYDQLAVLAPIMMALTGASPIFKGRLTDTDARWGVISESVDCRTPSERGMEEEVDDDDNMAGKGKRRIYKSRYDSISTFIYQGGTDEEVTKTNGISNRVLNIYNDIPVEIDQTQYELLRENGIDPALSQHIAHLFIRDPLVVFDGSVQEVNNETQTEHFESIQSTNWQTVRWKPPPPRNSPNDPHIGWRFEFRPMELQLTDFENAANAVFIVLMTRVILAFDLNLYIPMSRVDLNMQRAHGRNAATQGKFFFRRHMADVEEGDSGYGKKYVSMFTRASSDPTSDANSQTNDGETDGIDDVSAKRKKTACATGSSENNSYEEMTMEEIMTGKGDYFPGLIPLVMAYLDHIKCDNATKAHLTKYLDLIQKRATGELMTTAAWMRLFVRNHRSYKGDSVVTDEIGHDLLTACNEIGLGNRHVPELLGDMTITPITTVGAYDKKLESKRVQNKELLSLLRRYTDRKSFNS